MWTDKHRNKSIQTKKQAALLRTQNGKSSKLLSNDHLKKILLTSGREYKCTECGVDKWNDKEITLELEHKDGDSFNNSLDNLTFLCPNCHSQTPSFRGRNKNTGKKKVTDEQLLQSLKEHGNIRQALISVGLSPRGGNYVRAEKLMRV